MVDTVGDFVAAINLMLRDLWSEPLAAPIEDASVVETMVGKGSENLVRSVLNHAQAQSIRAQAAIDLIAKYDQAFACYQHHYQAVSGLYSSVYPGVPEGLRALQAAGLKLACVTISPLLSRARCWR